LPLRRASASAKPASVSRRAVSSGGRGRGPKRWYSSWIAVRREAGGRARRLGAGVAAEQEVLAHRAEAVGREQGVARPVARADSRGGEPDAQLRGAVVEGRAQQPAPDAPPASTALDDRTQQARRAVQSHAQEARETDDLSAARVVHEQVALGVDAVARQLRVELLAGLPHRVQHEVRLGAGALRRQARGGGRVLGPIRADRHDAPSAASSSIRPARRAR
jgi:hypothetical protein